MGEAYNTFTAAQPSSLPCGRSKHKFIQKLRNTLEKEMSCYDLKGNQNGVVF